MLVRLFAALLLSALVYVIPVTATMIDCPDTGGNHLNYTQSTNLYACGTTDSGVLGFTAGSVPFINASGNLTQNNANFFWANATVRLGIGTASPGEKLSVINKVHDATIPSSYVTSITNAENAVNKYGLVVGTNWAAAENFVANFGSYNAVGGAFTSYVAMKGDGGVGIGTTTLNSDSKLEVAGHITTEGTAPTVSACGTTPSIVGNDGGGKVTVGTGVTTSCTLTFATAWANDPPCVASNNSDFGGVQVVSTTTTLVLDQDGGNMASKIFSYICRGRG